MKKTVVLFALVGSLFNSSVFADYSTPVFTNILDAINYANETLDILYKQGNSFYQTAPDGQGSYLKSIGTYSEALHRSTVIYGDVISNRLDKINRDQIAFGLNIQDGIGSIYDGMNSTYEMQDEHLSNLSGAAQSVNNQLPSISNELAKANSYNAQFHASLDGMRQTLDRQFAATTNGNHHTEQQQQAILDRLDGMAGVSDALSNLYDRVSAISQDTRAIQSQQFPQLLDSLTSIQSQLPSMSLVLSDISSDLNQISGNQVIMYYQLQDANQHLSNMSSALSFATQQLGDILTALYRLLYMLDNVYNTNGFIQVGIYGGVSVSGGSLSVANLYDYRPYLSSLVSQTYPLVAATAPYYATGTKLSWELPYIDRESDEVSEGSAITISSTDPLSFLAQAAAQQLDLQTFANKTLYYILDVLQPTNATTEVYKDAYNEAQQDYSDLLDSNSEIKGSLVLPTNLAMRATGLSTALGTPVSSLQDIGLTYYIQVPDLTVGDTPVFTGLYYPVDLRPYFPFFNFIRLVSSCFWRIVALLSVWLIFFSFARLLRWVCKPLMSTGLHT